MSDKVVHSMPSSYHVPEMRRIQRIHFVGIGGAGMCGIAEVLLNQGYQISGSDIAESVTVKRLRNLGATVYLGHKESNVENADVVVVSTAIDKTNPEIKAASDARVPLVRRAEMLAELMRFRHGIAVAGTHGKTTTTSMISFILAEAGQDPTYVIGGKIIGAGSNAQLGDSRYLVAEADESDASFLHLQPMVAVVTNIDEDHMHTYGGDVGKLETTFVEFLHNLPFYGAAIVCIDSERVRNILPRVARPLLTYGIDVEADFSASDITTNGMTSTFSLRRKNKADVSITVSVPGRHNILNALAAIAVCDDEGVDDSHIIKGLSEFTGVGRRFQVLGDLKNSRKNVTLVDDYGHHPEEVSVTVDALRQVWPDRRVVMLFQPHRYTRTKDLYEDFVAALSKVDVLLMLDVYAAGEDVISGADAKSLCGSVRRLNKVDPIYVGAIERLDESLAAVLRDDDVLITQGAGNVGAISARLFSEGLTAEVVDD